MPQSIVSQFDRKYALPIETYRQVQNITQRNAIPAPIRWEGMMCYVISEGLSYVLTAGMENSDWVEFGALVNVTVVDDLLSNSSTDALSANQGRVLKDLIDNIDLSDYQLLSEKGSANGYAPLDSGAKVPIANLPDSLVGQVSYQGTWAASSNTPTLSNPPDSSTKGHYYVASDNGTQFGISFQTGDWIISNGTAWEKVDNTDAVTSVFGRLGNVVANAGDYAAFYLRSDVTTVKTGGNLTFANNLRIVGRESGGAERNMLFMSTLNNIEVGSVANTLDLSGATVNANGFPVWTSGNDGAGSGLDADLLDGVQGGSFLRSDETDTKTAGNTIYNDNLQLSFGNSGDMRLFHDGTNNAIMLTNGDLQIRDGSTTRVTIGRTTGNMTATGTMTATNFILSSDRRLKKDIEDYTPAHIPIRWREFTWKESGERQIGTIAQETPKQFVTKGADGKLAVKTVELLMAKVAELEARIINLER